MRRLGFSIYRSGGWVGGCSWHFTEIPFNWDYRDFLHDILDAINDIETFIDDLSYTEFVKDRKTLNAVILASKSSERQRKTSLTEQKQITKICLGNGCLA